MHRLVPVPLLLLLLLLACLLDILRYLVLALYVPVVSGFFHLHLHCEELYLRIKPRVYGLYRFWSCLGRLRWVWNKAGVLELLYDCEGILIILRVFEYGIEHILHFPQLIHLGLK